MPGQYGFGPTYRPSTSAHAEARQPPSRSRLVYQETSFRLRQRCLVLLIAGCYIGVDTAGLKNTLAVKQEWLRLFCALGLHAFDRIVILLRHLRSHIHTSIFNDP